MSAAKVIRKLTIDQEAKFNMKINLHWGAHKEIAVNEEEEREVQFGNLPSQSVALTPRRG